jgi:hypothetical protein
VDHFVIASARQHATDELRAGDNRDRNPGCAVGSSAASLKLVRSLADFGELSDRTVVALLARPPDCFCRFSLSQIIRL